MNQLPFNWYYSEWVDVEYKRYLLLAYLNHVRQHFNQTKLYPPLADLVAHYRNLHDFLRMKKELEDDFHKDLQSVDLKRFKLSYQSVIANNELMEIIEEIVMYALPQIQKTLDEGKEIYEFVERLLSMDPVGILPIYRNEGYLIIKDGAESDLRVFNYEIKLFENQNSPYRAVSTTYLDTYKNGLVNTGENIKIDLIRKYRKLPNPATFFVYSELKFPLDETLLQVVKRRLHTWVNQA